MKKHKSYRFKFNSLIWVLLAVLLTISLASVGLNVYSLVLAIKNDAHNVAIKAVLLGLCTLLPLFTLSVMLYSKYVVKNGCVYCYFGFIRSKTEASQIAQFTLFKKSDSLVAYLTDEKYMVIVIKPQEYDGFVKAVKELNSKIVFDYQEELN